MLVFDNYQRCPVPLNNMFISMQLKKYPNESTRILLQYLNSMDYVSCGCTLLSLLMYMYTVVQVGLFISTTIVLIVCESN